MSPSRLHNKAMQPSSYCNPHTLKIGWNGSPKDLAQNASQLAFLVRRELLSGYSSAWGAGKLLRACG